HFLATGAVCALGGVGVQGAALESGIFPLRSVVASSTVSCFASRLLSCEDVLPPISRGAIELARADLTPCTLAKERRCAEFFALLAVRRIAPRALRRAGYDALALLCESQPDLGGALFAADAARQTIGTEHGWSTLPPLASVAYAVSEHAGMAAFNSR